MSDPVRWDGSLEALRHFQQVMPDCLVSHDRWSGVLCIRTERNPEAPVPFGWHVTRVRDGIAALVPPEGTASA